ncbi:unnamed protein product [Lupinus luteus]|uniref:Uncharacterized protein n=1 Tax=Lupinus luteus TaxID=3873 RepID=A0AAV1XQ44_LUPLU
MASKRTSYASFQRQSSEVSDSKMSYVLDIESMSSIDQDERKFNEQGLSQEAEFISNNDLASGGAEQGSQSLGENDSMEMIKEVEIVLGGVKNPIEMQFYPETEEVEIHEQLNAGETHSRIEPTDEDKTSRSSQSAPSEVIENIPYETTNKIEILKQEDGEVSSEVGESGISTHASMEESISK